MALFNKHIGSFKKHFIFVGILLSLFIFPKSLLAVGGGGTSDPGMDCIDGFPFCPDDNYNFTNVSDGSSAPSGPNYGCLYSQPNPVWYFMEIAEDGIIQLNLAQSSQPNGGGSGQDVDFAMWGPFTDLSSGCGQIMSGSLSPLQCSYSAAPTETIGIGATGGFSGGQSTPPAAQVGEIYIVLITNYNGNSGYITFEQTNAGQPGAGESDCSIVEPCSITGISATASACNPVDNSFSISGNVTFTDPPDDGLLTIEDCSGNTQTFSPPFTSPTAFSFTGYDSDGTTCVISATFTDNLGDLMCTSESDPVQNPVGCTCAFTDLTLGTVTPSELDCYGDCDGEISVNVTGGDGVITFEWRDGGGNILGGTNSTATGLCAGNYTFTATDESGCAVAGSASITNPPLEDASFSLTDFCEGENNTASNIALPGGVFSFNPVPTDGATINPTTGQISNEKGGTTYTVQYSTPNCNITSTQTVTINDNLYPQFEGDSLLGCRPHKVNFTNLSGVNNASCVWNFGDGNTLEDCGNVSHTYNSSGLFDVTLTITSAGGCSGTLTLEDYVDVRPQPAAKFMASPTTITNYDNTVYFYNQSIDADGYTWSFGDETGTSSEENPTHVYNTNDIEKEQYIVELIAHSDIGCSDTTALLIVYEEEVIFYVPNTFTPDNDDFNDFFLPIISAGVDPYKYSLFIYNRWGETMFESHDISKGWDGTYGDQPVKEGTYVWKIEFGLNNTTDDKQTHQGHVNVIR